MGKTVNTGMPERPVKVEHYLFGVRLGYIAGGVGWGDEVGTEHNQSSNLSQQHTCLTWKIRN